MSTTVTTTIVAQPEVRPEAKPELQALRREIAGLERHGYLFGKKLTQSFSPFLHDVIYRELGLNWSQIRLDSTDMNLFLRLVRAPSFYGASVTMPHKVAIIRHLDELTEECRDVGACNTLFLRSDPATGRRLLCGANTDVIGVRESFYQNVPDPDAVFHGRPALVLGGGGAARSAVYALHRWMRATEIYVVNRDDAEVAAVQRECADRGFGARLRHVRTVDEARALPAPGAIVGCVPDFTPVTPDERRARDVVRAFLDKPEKGAMLEMCYNPTPYTELAAIAEEAGWQVILGTEALIWQGIAQDRYWTGQELPPETVKVVQQAIASRLPRR